MSIWRRIRGLLGTALTWAVLWLVVGAAFALYIVGVDGSELLGSALEIIGWVSAFYAAWGAISGAAFAALLTVAERRRSVNELSTLRVILWGTLGALALPVFYVAVLSRWLSILEPSVLFFALPAGLGAVSAAATLRLVRRPVGELQSKSTSAGSLTRG